VLGFKKSNAVVLLTRGGFSDVAHQAVAGIAMAGTATEQLVGLGKPVFTLPGSGSQFTAAFAEAQSRLLGQSVHFCFENLYTNSCPCGKPIISFRCYQVVLCC
jgi:uncharacterized protein (TIGR03492 family)